MILLVVILITILILILYNLFKVKKQVSKAKTSITPPIENQYKLLHYSPNIVSGEGVGLFQAGREFWISDQSNVVNVRDIYPAFTGSPIGFVVIPSSSLQSHQSPHSYIIFSSDGKVYNPFSTSHNWRNDFLYLPQTLPISVDGRPLEAGITGLFSGGLKQNKKVGSTPDVGGLLFRFYYSGYYIEESGCTSGSDGFASCNQSKVPFPHPSVSMTSFYQYSGVQYGISPDGWIYKVSNNEWVRDLKWTEIFQNLTFPTQKQNSTDKTVLYLLGADYDDGVPVFMIFERGVRYIVDRHARKYDFTKSFQSEGILPEGNPLDFTKAGRGEYDYLVLYTDRKVYGPSLPSARGYSKSVKDFEDVYSANNGGINGEIVSITSVEKWQNTTDNPREYTFKYYLVLLYSSGEWFEVQYDIQSGVIGGLGQTFKNSSKWTEFDHVRSVTSKNVKISSFGWSVFTYSQSTDHSANMVYSINNPPESWLDMLYCTNRGTTSTGTDSITASRCVGLGGWKDFEYKAQTPSSRYKNFIVYKDTGIDTDSNPGEVVYKTSLEKCLSTPTHPVVIYDSNESDCHKYSGITQTVSLRDPSKTTYVLPEYNAMYQNRFCVKHNPTGKYMYWDFQDPDNQSLQLTDVCGYSGPSNPTDTGNVISLQKSLGSMWSLSNNGLLNLNGAVGGYLQAATSGISQTSDGQFGLNNGMFTGTGGSCFHASPFSQNSVCNPNEWTVESIPCSSNPSSNMSNYCV